MENVLINCENNLEPTLSTDLRENQNLESLTEKRECKKCGENILDAYLIPQHWNLLMSQGEVDHDGDSSNDEAECSVHGK
jgi:hypothetical protein